MLQVTEIQIYLFLFIIYLSLMIACLYYVYIVTDVNVALHYLEMVFTICKIT